MCVCALLFWGGVRGGGLRERGGGREGLQDCVGVRVGVDAGEGE